MTSYVEVTTGDDTVVVAGGSGGGARDGSMAESVSRKNVAQGQESEGASVVRGSVGWMNRSEVRKRVYAGMTPGQKRAKHVITGKELDMEGRQWIWDYWNNYKAATVGLSMFGIVVCLVSIVFMLSARGAYIDGQRDYWTLCDWTASIRCSPLWTSYYAYGFGLFEGFASTAESDADANSSFWVWLTSITLLDFLQMPNDLYLMLFYVAQIILSEKRGPKFVKCQLALSAAAASIAAYLAHALVAIFGLWACPIAVLQFGVNCGVALANVTRWRAIKKLEQSKKA